VASFVGRTGVLASLATAYRAVAEPSGGRVRRRAGLVLVAGEAGIGKTSVLARHAAWAAEQGARPVWGACWEDDRAPAFWPWTQALRQLLDESAGWPERAPPELAAVLPELAAWPAATDAPAGRLRLFDAVSRLLGRAVADGPVVAILDDLQWSDVSTLDLVRFLVGQTYPGGLQLVGAYRPEELSSELIAAMAGLASAGESVPLAGLTRDEIGELVTAMAGAPTAARWATLVHTRTGGHPFFAKELIQLAAAGGVADGIPAAVREAIGRRLSRLSGECADLLAAAAVAGSQLLPDVLAEVTGGDLPRVAELVEQAIVAGLVAGDGGSVRFAHDLYRESIYASVPPRRRLELHDRVAAALVRRAEHGGQVFPAELARHFTAALPITGPEPGLRWSRAAAAADRDRFAFAEAAGHLTRLRTAAAETGHPLPEPELVDLLTTEADLRLRAGDAGRARQLLELAWARAAEAGDPHRIGAVALGLDRIGARFAMPRTELVAALDRARRSLAGTGTALEAEVIAALARQLQHSIPADRPRAGPLAERAVAIARTLDDPAPLATCLLAHHDVLWTAGTAIRRAAIAREIAELAKRAGDPERRAQGLLLTASAQLESGWSGFRATATEYEHVTRQLRQPRHDYLLQTRLAALALLDGDIDAGDRLSARAAELGESVGDTDTGNVRMSQRLEVARARGDADELRATAAAAVRWWVGAPAHAHAVAAGFLARAGDLDPARRELDIVLSLDDLRTDRSYLWSVFVGELVVAAIALHDHPLCTQLLDDLLPIADTCAVNGALVCFMGAHAHRVGSLYAALGQPDRARHWLGRAVDIHRRLGARAWEVESATALSTLDQDRPGRVPPHRDPVELHLVGDLWRASFRGRTAYLRDRKGLHDLAALIAQPGVDLSALALAGASHTADPGAPVLDRAALTAYRRRLAELDEQLAAANVEHDLARQQLAVDERERLLTELRHATRPGGSPRTLGATAAERARKAVTARIRDAIRRIQDSLPELGTYLDRTIRTGTTCRYDPL
jgi:tetratricopeptide (TPR) repeat protein